MSISEKQRATNRFYNHSYIVLPIPIVASIIFAFYVVLTGDENIDAYCTIAMDKNAYSHAILKDKDFESREKVTLDICKDRDYALDEADGREQGRVRWFICKGTTCGPGWEKFLAKR